MGAREFLPKIKLFLYSKMQQRRRSRGLMMLSNVGTESHVCVNSRQYFEGSSTANLKPCDVTNPNQRWNMALNGNYARLTNDAGFCLTRNPNSTTKNPAISTATGKECEYSNAQWLVSGTDFKKFQFSGKDNTALCLRETPKKNLVSEPCGADAPTPKPGTGTVWKFEAKPWFVD